MALDDDRVVVDLRGALKIMGCQKSHWYGYIVKKGLVTPISHGRRRIRYLRTEVEALAKRGYY